MDVNISGWSNDSSTARFTDEGHQLPYTDFVKSVTSKPVVGVGRFTSPDTMVSLLRKGTLDLIGAARPSIADPFLPKKIAAGNLEDIRECIGCNICVSMDSYGLPLRCTQNPTIAEEWRHQWHPEAPAITTGKQSHLIIGAGPAGLECATTLARAGHQVTIAERLATAGGRVSRESALPGLSSWARVRDYRLYQISQSANAQLYLDSELSVPDIESFDADHVVIATGATWRRDGVGSSNFDACDFSDAVVITPDDVMNGAYDHIGAKVVVYDDDHFYMASVIAEALNTPQRQVHYVTPLAQVATWTDHTLDQSRIITRLRESGIAMHPNTELSADGTLINVLSMQQESINYDAIVFVGARLPNNDLYNTLNERGNIAQLHRAGDCLVPGIIQAAVLSGHRVARSISGKQNANASREQVALRQT
ncbi:MAG: FAD-dependent oxidoreductase [Pseudomonadota bacterium]